jgi:hypothetical protein
MRSALLSMLFLSAFCAWGCSSDRDAMEKRLAELGKDIQRLQSSNDELADRLGDLETKVATAPAAPRSEPGEKRLERPPLRVVKLVPGADAELPADGGPAVAEVAPDERPDAPGQRPVIRLRGGKESRSSDASDTLARQGSEDSR